MSTPIRQSDSRPLRTSVERAPSQTNTLEPLPRAAQVDDGWEGLRGSRRLLPTALTVPAEETVASGNSLDATGVGKRVDAERARAQKLAADVIALSRSRMRDIRRTSRSDMFSRQRNGIITFSRDQRDERGSLQRRETAGTSVGNGSTRSLVETIERDSNGWTRTLREGSLSESGEFSIRESRSFCPGRREPEEADWRHVPEQGTVIIQGSATELRRIEETTDSGVQHRAQITFREQPAGKVKLPGDLSRALDSTQPVWEEEMERSTKSPYKKRRTKSTRENITTWHQGAVRVHCKRVLKNQDYVVEQQVGPHTLRTQHLRSGSPECIRTETERLEDGSEREVRECWESRGGAFGPWKVAAPVRTSLQEIRRQYDEAGTVIRQEMETTDPDSSSTGKRFSAYERTTEGDDVTHTLRLELPQDGKVQVASMSQRLRQVGEKTELKEVQLESNEEKLHLLFEDGECLVRHHHPDTGAVKEQRVTVQEGKDSVVLHVDGEKLEVGLAGGVRGHEKLTPIGASDVVGLPLLAAAEEKEQLVLDQILAEVEFFESMSSPARASLAFLGVASSKIFEPLAFIGPVRDSYKALKEASAGNDYKATLHGLKATAATGKIVFPWLDLPLGLAPVLGFAGATADLALGIHGYQGSKNGFGRMGSAAKLGTSSLAFGALAGMPELPLLGSVLLLEGVGAFATYKDKHFIPPLATGEDDWFSAAKPAENT